MSFENWKKKLRGETVISFVTGPVEKDEGYYRIKVTEKAPNGSGRNILKGYIPVAYFLYDGKLTGNIGGGDNNRPMTDDEVIEKWQWCCAHPIPYDWYQAVAERGEAWPDSAEAQLNRAMGADADTQEKLEQALKPTEKLVMDDGKGNAIPAKLDANGGLVPASDRVVRLGDNQPTPPPVVEEEPHVIHAREIDAAIAATVKAVTTDDEASLALGAKNRIAELRLKAEKVGKSLYEPPFREYKKILGTWKPIIDRASANEAVLDRQIKVYRQGVLKKAAEAAAAEQARIAQEEAANARAADRAIAQGIPEPAPQVTEPAPAPPPVAPLVPAYGTRKLKEEEKTWIDEVTDWKALAAHYAGNAAIQELLKKLALNDVRAGLMVPGVTTRRGII